MVEATCTLCLTGLTSLGWAVVAVSGMAVALAAELTAGGAGGGAPLLTTLNREASSKRERKRAESDSGGGCGVEGLPPLDRLWKSCSSGRGVMRRGLEV